jgi:hypothetical protein
MDVQNFKNSLGAENFDALDAEVYLFFSVN